MEGTAVPAGERPGTSGAVLKYLLACGILSSVVYIATDVVAATVLYPGYHYASQQVSELAAVGAPTRPFWIAMSSVWTPLVIAFGVGVVMAARRKRSMRLTGMLLVAWAVVGYTWLLFPMHPRGTVEVEADAMHIAVAVVQLLIMVLFMSSGAAALGRAFRFYSAGTIATMLAFGALVGTQASAIAEGQATPWAGIVERVSVYLPFLWVIALAFVLLRTHTGLRPATE